MTEAQTVTVFKIKVNKYDGCVRRRDFDIQSTTFSLYLELRLRQDVPVSPSHLSRLDSEDSFDRETVRKIFHRQRSSKVLASY